MENHYTLAQDSVIGSIVLDARCAGEVLPRLRPSDFDEGLRRNAFAAIRELYLDSEKIDPVTVLNKIGNPDPACRTWMLGVMDTTPTAANVLEYAAVVREQARLRDVQMLGAKLSSSHLTMEEARTLAGQLDNLLMERRSVEDLSMKQCLINFYEEMEHTPDYLRWGIEFLDDGLTAEASDYVVLGGYPSDGKTALALSMAYSQAKTKRVAFFSLETKSSKLFNRIFSTVAQVPGSRIKRRSLTEEDFTKLEKKADEIQSNNLHLIKASSMTVEDIGTYARARKYDIIYIDYLTLIPAPGRTEFDQATYISKSLHRLAQDNNITVVALSQLSRPEDKKKPAPTLGSLRSSGQIEQDADIVMFIYRENPQDIRSRRILRIAKNKEGPTGTVKLDFDGETQTFSVADDDDGMEHSKEVANKFAAQGRKIKRSLREKHDFNQTTFTELTAEEAGELPF